MTSSASSVKSNVDGTNVAAKTEPKGEPDYLDIPAFLRKQAD
jgi:hypothetical protein